MIVCEYLIIDAAADAMMNTSIESCERFTPRS